MMNYFFLVSVIFCCFALQISYLFGAENGSQPREIEWQDYKIEVNQFGNLGRIYLARGWDEFELMCEKAAKAGKELNVWKAALVMVKNLEVEWEDFDGNKHLTKASLTDEAMEHIKKGYEKFEKMVYAYSGGNLKFDSKIYVIDGPVKRKDKKGFFFFGPFKEELKQFEDWKPEEVDSVICFFPPGDMPMDAFGRSWGDLHGFNCAGNSNIAYVDERLKAGGDISILMQHEWLHQVESVMGWHLGYLGLPDLHAAGFCGYEPGDVDQPQWLAWNRDFMFRLYRPVMWQKADMNSRSIVTPKPQFDDGFIKEWLILGPFPNEDRKGLDVDFMRTPVSENNAVPDAEAEKFLKDEKKWFPVKVEEEKVDLTKFLEPKDNVVAYAHTYVYSPERMECKLWVGSDDGIKVILNGIVVHNNKVYRMLLLDNDVVDVVLKKGWNRLLLKIDQGGGGWGFSARISDSKYQKIDELKFSVNKPEEEIVMKGEELPPRWDGKFYSWEDVKDDPWRMLPKLTVDNLRVITRIDNLELKNDVGILLVDTKGSPRVYSETLAEIDPDDFVLNNELHYRNESVAHIRFRSLKKDERFPSDVRDLLFIRFDIIDPYIDFLQSKTSVPIKDSLIGYVAVQKQLAYVIYTYLGEYLPRDELSLIHPVYKGLRLTSYVHSPISLGEKAAIHIRLKNEGTECVKNCKISLHTRNPMLSVPPPPQLKLKGNEFVVDKIEPSEAIRQEFHLTARPNIEEGIHIVRVDVEAERGGEKIRVGKELKVEVQSPVSMRIYQTGTSVVKGGTEREIIAHIRNNVGFVGKVRVILRGDKGIQIRRKEKEITLVPTQKDVEVKFTARFPRVSANKEMGISATLVPEEKGLARSSAKMSVIVGAKRLIHNNFEKGFDGWQKRIGVYSVEHGIGKEMNGKGYAIVDDGGGCRYGSVRIFGPRKGEEKKWTTSYDTKDYPFLDFYVATKSDSNSAVIVKADGQYYAIVLTGKFIEQWGNRKELANLHIVADGKPQHIVYNLDEALDKMVPEGSHRVEEILFGDTKTHSSNQWRGEDIHIYKFDDFVVR